MNILFIVLGAVAIGGLSESFGGVVVGGIVGFLVAEMLKLSLNPPITTAPTTINRIFMSPLHPLV